MKDYKYTLLFVVLALAAATFALVHENHLAKSCHDRGGVWLGRERTCLANVQVVKL